MVPPLSSEDVVLRLLTTIPVAANAGRACKIWESSGSIVALACNRRGVPFFPSVMPAGTGICNPRQSLRRASLCKH